MKDKSKIDEILFGDLEVIIHNKIHDYIYKYHTHPKYMKIPLWIFHCLQQNMIQLGMKIDYETGNFKYNGLILCETITINKVEEIEVF